MDQIYFFQMVSFITISIVVVLVYVFLTLYLKTINNNLNRHMNRVGEQVEKLKDMINNKK